MILKFEIKLTVKLQPNWTRVYGEMANVSNILDAVTLTLRTGRLDQLDPDPDRTAKKLDFLNTIGRGRRMRPDTHRSNSKVWRGGKASQM